MNIFLQTNGTRSIFIVNYYQHLKPSKVASSFMQSNIAYINVELITEAFDFL